MRLTYIVQRSTDRPALLPPLLAGSSVGAGVIHASVIPEHLEEAWVFGFFFILAAAFQVAWAIPALTSRSSDVYLIGAAANGAMIGIWLLSRTLGVPVGPEPWVAESVGVLDIAATGLELVLVAGSLAILRARPHAARGRFGA
jgi:hypothetical protein